MCCIGVCTYTAVLHECFHQDAINEDAECQHGVSGEDNKGCGGSPPILRLRCILAIRRCSNARCSPDR